MPTYKITDPDTGKIVRVTGDSPPTEQELNDIFSSVHGVKPTTTISTVKTTTTTVPKWGQQSPNLYGAAGAAYEVGKPIIEALGMGAGAAAGTASAGPIGGVAGSGLGYAGARQLTSAAGQALGIETPKTAIQAGKQALTDIPSGAAMEAGGQILGTGISAGIERLRKSAPSLYESAMKPSTTLSASARSRRIETALKEEIPVSKKGLEKSKEIVSNINNQIKDKIANATGVTVSRDMSLVPVAELSGKVKATKIDPESDLQSIAGFIKEIQESQPQQIPIQQAQVFKQTLNKELNDYYAAFSRGKVTPPQITAKTKAAMADGLRYEIADAFPELKNMNSREGSLIELNKSLERAVNRIRNREIIPLLTGIALGTSPAHAVTKALLLKAVEHPEVKSKLAIALYKASAKTAGQLAKSGLQSGLLAFNKQIKAPDINLVSSAEAGEVPSLSTSLSARQKAIQEATSEPTAATVSTKQSRQAEPTMENIRPSRLKQFSSGAWKIWDDYNQDWMTTDKFINASPANKRRMLQGLNADERAMLNKVAGDSI